MLFSKIVLSSTMLFWCQSYSILFTIWEYCFLPDAIAKPSSVFVCIECICHAKAKTVAKCYPKQSFYNYTINDEQTHNNNSHPAGCGHPHWQSEHSPDPKKPPSRIPISWTCHYSPLHPSKATFWWLSQIADGARCLPILQLLFRPQLSRGYFQLLPVSNRRCQVQINHVYRGRRFRPKQILFAGGCGRCSPEGSILVGSSRSAGCFHTVNQAEFKPGWPSRSDRKRHPSHPAHHQKQNHQIWIICHRYWTWLAQLLYWRSIQNGKHCLPTQGRTWQTLVQQLLRHIDQTFSHFDTIQRRTQTLRIPSGASLSMISQLNTITIFINPNNKLSHLSKKHVSFTDNRWFRS